MPEGSRGAVSEATGSSSRRKRGPSTPASLAVSSPAPASRGESVGVGSLGVRPEALQIARSEAAVPGGSFRHAADVTGILPTGGSWIIELKVDGRALFVTTTESPVLKGGERVLVHARPTAVHVFDGSGNRISAADEVLARAA